MTDDIDHYTKKKARNAYLLFTAHFIEEYKQRYGDRRFGGNFTRAINDPLIVEAWDKLPQEQRQFWKDRAREEKARLVNEFSEQLKQYVDLSPAVQENPAEDLDQNEQSGFDAPDGGQQSGADNQPGAENQTDTLRAQSAFQLRRFLRSKKNKRQDESKYAPAFMEDFSTAKHFEEKRRRERECLNSIWVWKVGFGAEDKGALRKETFFLVSTYSPGVQGDLHIPGSISCVEFSIDEGIKREFSCAVGSNFGRVARPGRSGVTLDCQVSRMPSDICHEIFGDWLRSAHRDLSSKTPIFFCLADEFPETYDCLTYIYGNKDFCRPSRFSPYLLGTMDDLFWCLLRFFEVPFGVDDTESSTESQQQGSRLAPVESFCLGRMIDQYFTELTNSRACDSHRQQWQAGGQLDAISTGQSGGAAGGDGWIDRQHHRCPLAVVRACAILMKNWIDNKRVDEQVVVASSALAAEAKATTDQEISAGSIKSEEIDQHSFLALEESDDERDRTFNSEIRRGRHDSGASDDSGDIVELPSEKERRSIEGLRFQRHPPPMLNDQMVPTRSNVESQASVTAVATAQSKSCISSRESTSFREPTARAIYVDTAMMGVSSNGNVVIYRRLWADTFRIPYEAQLRLPHGCRGMGRGLPIEAMVDDDEMPPPM